MTTNKMALITIAFIIMSTTGYGALSANHKGPTSTCEGVALGLCTTQLFKSYVACVETNIPNWDPKGPVLSKRDFPVETSMHAVLVECEPIGRAFGTKYGNKCANILQSIANRKISEQYTTHPLTNQSGDISTFLEYGQHIDPTDIKRGDVTDRYKGFRRVIP
jgi:hypothetical protein